MKQYSNIIWFEVEKDYLLVGTDDGFIHLLDKAHPLKDIKVNTKGKLLKLKLLRNKKWLIATDKRNIFLKVFNCNDEFKLELEENLFFNDLPIDFN